MSVTLRSGARWWASRVACAALVVLGAASCDAPREAGSVAAPSRPNILWVVWDTVRADHMSLYGHSKATTPKLERWAAGARVFGNALSAANTTLSSHASMFTGLLPSQHGADASNRWLADELETVAERLGAVGYRSYLWSANPHISAEENFQQGFEREEHPWDDAHREAATRIVREKVRGDVSTELAARMQRPEVGPWSIKASGELAGPSLLRWLSDSEADGADRPWFALLNYMEAHRPLIPGRKYRERVMTPEQVAHSYTVDRSWLPMWNYTVGLREYSALDLAAMGGIYDAAIAELDDLFAELLAQLSAAGELDDTAIILTADHGELLGEHHMLDHQYSLHRPLLAVPLVIHYPKHFEPGRDTRPVSTLDLYPTVLELAGLDSSSPRHSSARSLQNPADSRTRVAEYSAANIDPLRGVERQHPGWTAEPWDRELRLLDDGRYEFIWGSDGRHELYDLRRDPLEQHNLVESESAVVARMQADLDSLVAAFAEQRPATRPARELSPEMRQLLIGLGYLSEDDSAAEGDRANSP